MGISIGSTIAYGFVIYELDGYKDPAFDILDLMESSDVTDSDCYDRYMLAEAAYSDGVFKGVTVEFFGHYDFQTYALVISESVQSSDWNVEVFQLNKMQIQEEWDEMLKTTTNILGLEYRSPTWIFGGYVS